MSPYILQIVLIFIYISKITPSYVYQYPGQYHPNYSPTPQAQSYHNSYTQSYSKPKPEYKSYHNYPPPIVYQKPQVEQPKPCSKPQTIPEPFVKTPEPFVQMPEPFVQMPEPFVKLPEPGVSSVEKNTGFDTNVLNNLAIALQLLIVSNIINNPPQSTIESCQEYEKPPEANIWDVRSQKVPEQTDVNYPPYAKLPRPGRLMSPYESINKNSYSDVDKYSAKKDFQNPYSAILAYENNKDLFSMADIF